MLSFCTGAYPCLSKLNVSLKLRRGGGRLCLAGCHFVAQTQGYHLVCIWGSLVKFQGGGVVVKFNAFLHCYAVSLCCWHASNGRSASMKNWLNWGNAFAFGDTDTKNCPFECLIFHINEDNFTFVTFRQTILSNGSSCIQ